MDAFFLLIYSFIQVEGKWGVKMVSSVFAFFSFLLFLMLELMFCFTPLTLNTIVFSHFFGGDSIFQPKIRDIFSVFPLCRETQREDFVT